MPLYELEEGESRKFYRVEREGTRVHLHWGRIGTAGEKQTLDHETEQEATAEYDRQRLRRRERGYRVVVDETKPHDVEAARKERLARTAPLTKNPRFYFVNKKAKSFVWVEARERELLTAEGPLGKEGSAPVVTESLPSAAAAVKKRDATVADLLGKGYALADFGAAEAKPKTLRAPKSLQHNDELEDRVREAPDDEVGWTVLEDWLLERDDPRAELVRLEKGRMQGDAAQARGRLAPLLFGPKAKLLERQRCSWRAGFALDCTLEIPARKGVELMEAFTSAPAMRLLRALDVRGDIDASHLELLARAPFAKGLRALTLLSVVGVEALSSVLERRAAPNVVALSLLGLHHDMVDEVIDVLAKSALLPQLRSLAFGWAESSPAILRAKHGNAFDQLVSMKL